MQHENEEIHIQGDEDVPANNGGGGVISFLGNLLWGQQPRPEEEKKQ